MTVEQNEAREESRRIIAEQAALIRQLGEAYSLAFTKLLKLDYPQLDAKELEQFLSVKSDYENWKARQS